MPIVLPSPWWVNGAILTPFLFFFLLKNKFYLSKRVLFLSIIFALAFGFIEASVVVYLRSDLGAAGNIFVPSSFLGKFPADFIFIETLREASTVILLITAAMLSVKKIREQVAVFLWSFSLWDIFYYASLYYLIGWPQTIFSQDVLFLIPVPWISQVWFPLLVSVLTVFVILFANRS